LYNKRIEERTKPGPKKLFFSQRARASAKQYFLEGYANYLTHPEILRDVDDELFKLLKVKMFKGKEYIKNSI